MNDRSIFEVDGDRYVPTELARGPWDQGALHGGSIAALIMRDLEAVAGERLVVRVTYEFFRPVPLAPLEVTASAVREGRSAAWLQSTLSADDRIVAQARAIALRRGQVEIPPQVESPPPGPEAGAPIQDPPSGSYPAFHNEGMEVRFVEGSLVEPGPAVVWFRMAAPLVPEEEPSPMVRVAAAADFSNGASSVVSWADFTFINPDLTIYVNREPEGPWICLDAVTRTGPHATGIAESRLFDQRGPIGTTLQSVLLEPLGP